MRLSDIQPFVRYARVQSIIPLWDGAIGLDNRIFVCTSGSGAIAVDGVRYPVMRGSVIGWRAGMTYSYHPDKEGMTFIGCNYDFTSAARDKAVPVPPCKAVDFKKEMLLEKPDLIDDAPALSTAFCIMAEGDIVEKMSLINLEYTRGMLFSSERCDSLLKDLLVQCARIAQTAEGDAHSKIAEQVISYVGTHLNENLTNVALAEKFNYHPNYISRVMRDLTGLSLHSYVLERRISKAIELLESTTLSVTEISARTGFGDLSHFSKLFRKKTGKCPSDFRLQIIREEVIWNER